MKTEKTRALFAGAGIAFLMLVLSLPGNAHAQVLSVVDVNGYISPRAQAEASVQADASVTTSNRNEPALLQATSGADTKPSAQAASSSLNEEQASSTAPTSTQSGSGVDLSAAGSGFLAQLQAWGRAIFSFFGFNLGTSTDTGTGQIATATPVVTTTSESAHIVLPQSSTPAVRVYYGSSTPIVIASTTPYVTSWGLSSGTVDLTHLKASSTYYYKVVPLGFGNATTSLEYSFTTQASTSTEKR